MEIFKWGRVVSIGKKYVIFESNQRGWVVYCAGLDRFKLNERMKLYVYLHSSEYSHTLFGFKSFKERLLFADLISVNGVGPKTAMAMLENGIDNILHALSSKDSKALSASPMVGPRTANQILFELHDKYLNFELKSKKMFNPNEVKNSLKTLGFTPSQIELAIQNLKPSDKIEEMIEEAIRIISNGKFSTT